MTRSSLPTAIAKQNAPRDFAARSFARALRQREAMALRAVAFDLPEQGKPATGHCPYLLSNTPLA